MKSILFPILIFISSLVFSQKEIPIGQWRDHLPYHNAVAVAESDEKIYCATENALFSYHKNDNSVERMTQIEGLSDIGVQTIAYGKTAKTLVIAYKNSNLDIIQNNKITNMADIKRSKVSGSKKVNHIYFLNELAYLSCDFGIVVLDVNKLEIKETYFIGPEGTNINVNALCEDGNNFYAATEKGIYKAPLNSPNLADYHTWKKQINIPDTNGNYNTIASFNGKIFVNLSIPVYNRDTIFYLDKNNSAWQYFDTTNSYTCHNLRVINNHLLTVFVDNLDVYNSDLVRTQHIYAYYKITASPADALMDEKNVVWIADNEQGLVKVGDGYEIIYPKGPSSTNATSLTAFDGELWVATGKGDIINRDGVFSFKENEWTTISEIADKRIEPALNQSVHDIVHISVNPQNKSQVYASSWGRGLVEITDNVVTNIFSEKDIPIIAYISPDYYSVVVTATAFDKDNNLWVVNAGSTNHLVVIKSDKTTAFFSSSTPLVEHTNGSILINQLNHKWVLINGGIYVLDDNGTIDNPLDDREVKLIAAEGAGGLPSGEIFSFAEDLDGAIWVGTDKGIAVFYNPATVFDEKGFDAQQIKIQQDSYVQNLLEAETVTAIAVDDANRKWFGTDKGGVFLMSADGTEEILAFNTSNSPLFSNTIMSIAINHKNGEVFFGTDKGLISYKSDATEGLDEYKKVYAYPNPVQPNYEGVIAIKGLVKNVDVRITDIAGILVYQTKALGGQATWNGKNMKGEKAQTGVYLVFCSNDDGGKTIVTKILILN